MLNSMKNAFGLYETMLFPLITIPPVMCWLIGTAHSWSLDLGKGLSTEQNLGLLRSRPGNKAIIDTSWGKGMKIVFSPKPPPGSSCLQPGVKQGGCLL